VDIVEHLGYQAVKLKNKINQSLCLIAEMFEVCQNPYISMSFGKDSTVMTDLILKYYPKTTVIYCYCGKFDEWPDTPRVRDEFLKRHRNCNFYQVDGPSIIEYYRRLGYVYIQDLESTPKEKKLQREYGASLEKAIIETAKQLGCDGSFIGMRKAESRDRARLVTTRGEIYFASTRKMWTCLPIAQWTAKQVWGYIVQNNLSWNELYDIDQRGRERARNGAMFGTRGDTGLGRMSMMRKMYPALWNEFLQEFPEISERT
jgi:3'-phosphoadenosine 5'-phosphosulfate sulfotransferase (PAPS reductase)/FAD synthetase